MEVSGFGGYEWRGQPDDFDTAGGAFRWGAGVAFPSRNFLRVNAELNGLVPSNDTTTITGPTLRAVDNSFAPTVSSTQNLTRATFGVTAQAKNGFFGGVGVSWNVPSTARDLAFSQDRDDVLGDYYDWQLRIRVAYGRRTYVAPAPRPRRPRRPRPPRRIGRRPSARSATLPVEIGRSSTVTATGQDPDGDPLTYRWTVPTGTLANPAERQTIWTAPSRRARSGHGDGEQTAKAARRRTRSTSRCVRPTRDLHVRRVHFDFDGTRCGRKRPACSTNPERAAADATAAGAGRRPHVQHRDGGVQLALGDRRSNAVRTTSSSRGVTGGPAKTVTTARRSRSTTQRARRDAPAQPPRRHSR